MESIYSCPSATATYDAQNQWAIISFDGYPNTEDHKKMYQAIQVHAKTHKMVALLMNFKGFKGTFTNLSDWVIDTLRPCVATGLKQVALVLNDDVFTIFSANTSVGKVKLVEVQLFKDMIEAKQWMSQSSTVYPS